LSSTTSAWRLGDWHRAPVIVQEGPIRVLIDEMFATLARWTGPRRISSTAKQSASLSRNPALYRRLLRMFRDQQGAFMDRFAASRAAGDQAAATRQVHDLHSLAAMLGMQELRRTTLALEQASRRTAADPEIDELLHGEEQRLAPVLAGLATLMDDGA
jgi:HPt (histidine-containing phosphotransfer) domain-containing protein